jgi:hypothetical protein
MKIEAGGFFSLQPAIMSLGASIIRPSVTFE